MQQPIKLYHDMGQILGDTVGGFVTGGWGGAAEGAAMGIGSTISQNQQNQNQLTMQGTLGGMQVQNQEQLMQYNEDRNLDFWNKTNYSAQVEQLEKAGLNPALLYAKGGQGGMTLPGAPSAGMGIAPSAGNASQTNQANMAMMETAADVKLKNAEADNLAAKTPNEAPLMGAQTASLLQGVQNQQAQQMLIQAQTKAQTISNQIQGATISSQIDTIQNTATEIDANARTAVTNNTITQQTAQDKIDLIKGQMIGQFIRNNMDKSQTAVNNQQIEASIQQIQQNWRQIAINIKNASYNQQNADTNTMNAATNRTNATVGVAELNLQQYLKGIPDSKHTILQGLTRLIPNLNIVF